MKGNLMNKQKIVRYATNQTAMVVAATVITKTIFAVLPGTQAYPKATGLVGSVAGFIVCDKFEPELNNLADKLSNKL